MSQLVRQFSVPGLATINIDSRRETEPVLEIRLAAEYHGDLNDIARANPGPDNVYLHCDAPGAINNPALLEFVEVLSQWDTTGDDVPDYADVVAAIEQAMYLSEEAPHQFKRPNQGWYAKLVDKIMPPAPPFQIVFSFGDLKPRFRWYHHVAAVPMLAVMLALIQVQIKLLPWTRFSVVTGFTTAMSHSGLPSWAQNAIGIIAVVIIVNRLVGGRKRPKTGTTASNTTFSPYTIGFLNRAAVIEEQWFREGSQDWSFGQRLRSCVAFGVIHMTNLIYPLATIVPLTLGGGLFMAVYLHTFRKTRFRRAAVLNAAVWHRVYNRMAITAVAVALAWAFGAWGLSVLGGMVVLGYVSYRVKVIRHHRHFDLQIEEVPATVVD